MFCLNYNGPRVAPYLEKVNQIKINRDRLDDETLEEFFEQNQDKHIYIDVGGAPDIIKEKDKVIRLQGLMKYNNWTLQVPFNDYTMFDNIKLKAIKDLCPRFMFTDGAYSWEMLDAMLSFEPSEVYITGFLGFCLERVKRVCDKHGVKIRAYANLAQTEFPGINKNALKTFFIRPEDVWLYKDYIHGIEFVGDEKQQVVFYGVYKRGYWYGNLAELIIDFNEDIDSRKLPQQFGELRYNCGKRCISGGVCTACKTVREFHEIMDKTNTIVKPHGNN